MPPSNRPSKKHHFVPQAQLRHFAADADKSSIFVFAKDSSRSFRPSILNAGSENDFNTVSLGDAKWNFEDLFRDVDANSARLVDGIVSRNSVAWLTATDHLALVDLFATQLLRTHFSRTTPRQIAEGLRELTRQIGYNPDQDPSWVMPSDAALRLGAVKAFLNRGRQAAALARLVPALYATSGEEHFITSDHPIAITNVFPYGELGLTSHGILVLLPISPQLSIALHCPTIIRHYELAESADIDDERKARMRHYREHLRSGEPIKVGNRKIRELNSLQISQSARFLYAATDSFDFAREFLRDHPDLRKIDTHVEIGTPGRMPTARPNMPSGMYLVIFGVADHCMLAIEEIDYTAEELTVRTPDVGSITQLAADQGMLRTELFIDGQAVRGISGAMVECIGEPTSGWFRVVHRDPSLRALCAQINKRGI